MKQVKIAVEVVALIEYIKGHRLPLSGMTATDYPEIGYLEVDHRMCNDGLCAVAVDRHLKPHGGRLTASPFRFALYDRYRYQFVGAF